MKKLWKSAAVLSVCLIAWLGVNTAAYADVKSSVWILSGYEHFSGGLDLSAQTGDRSGNGWQWKAKEQQLILNGAKLYFTDDGVTLPDGAEIVLSADKRNVLIGEMDYGGSTMNGTGNLKISGSGELNIYSDNDGLTVEGEVILSGGTVNIYADDYGLSAGETCRIEAGSLMVDSTYTGLQCTEYIQQGGTVRMHTNNNAVWSESLVMNAGELYIEATVEGIYTDQFEMNGGLVDLAAAREGLAVREGNCIINDGTLQIKGYKSYKPLRGIYFYDKGQLIMHGGQLDITTCQCDNDDLLMNYAIGGVLDPAANDQRRVIIDGGEIKLSGKRVIEFVTGAPTGEIDESQMPLPEDVLQIDPTLVEMNGLQVGRIKQIAEGRHFEWYLYSMFEEGQPAQNAVLTARSSRIGGVYIDGKEISWNAADKGEFYIDENGRAMVPLRALTEAMGCTAVWQEDDQSIVITDKQGTTIVFYLDQTTYWVNGEKRDMDTAAISLPPGRTYIPLRFAAESLGAQVKMIDEAEEGFRITITTAE